MSGEISIPRLTKSLSHEGAIFHLLTVGRIFGYDTYTAHRSKMFHGTRLGSIATKEDISQHIQPDRLDIVRNIDVIWLERDVIKQCFEVVFTTSMREAALRLSEVSFALKLFIVGPACNRGKFNHLKEISIFREIWEKFKFVDCGKFIESSQILMAGGKEVGEVLG